MLSQQLGRLLYHTGHWKIEQSAPCAIWVLVVSRQSGAPYCAAEPKPLGTRPGFQYFETTEFHKSQTGGWLTSKALMRHNPLCSRGLQNSSK